MNCSRWFYSIVFSCAFPSMTAPTESQIYLILLSNKRRYLHFAVVVVVVVWSHLLWVCQWTIQLFSKRSHWINLKRLRLRPFSRYCFTLVFYSKNQIQTYSFRFLKFHVSHIAYCNGQRDSGKERGGRGRDPNDVASTKRITWVCQKIGMNYLHYVHQCSSNNNMKCT